MKKYNGPPQCDECHEFLRKDFVICFDGSPLTVWICPNSEIWDIYQKNFQKKYHQHSKRKK